jgi:hypothetical protein
MQTRDIVLSLLILVVGVAIFYLLDPTLGGLLNKSHEGFANRGLDYAEVLPASDEAPGVNYPTNNHADGYQERVDNMNAGVTNFQAPPTPNAQPPVMPPEQKKYNEVVPNSASPVEGFETISPSPMPFKDAQKPANCYPKDQIAPQELLPNDPNSKWAQVNPQGAGDIAGKNYLSAGALMGVNTIGQSLRNANYQLRSDPPNPQVKVSIWNQATIEPDFNRRSLEIG